MIYLDNHATTPVDPRVSDRIRFYETHEFGNASSIDHEWGDRAEAAVSHAAQQVADLIGASPNAIIWTSGSTESLNLAIQGTIKATIKTTGRSGILPRVAITAVEHKAVLDTCHALQAAGRIELVEIPVDAHARIDLNQLDQICGSDLHLLCIMAANNEVGTVYPIEKISAIAQQHQIPFLCDGSQAVGKVPIRFDEWGITMLALSGHKLYGPKGVGALVVKREHRLEPLMYGGDQQHGLRPGTLNVSGIVGLGEACRLRAIEMEDDEHVIEKKRDRLQHLLIEKIPGLIVNGNPDHRLAGNLHVSIPGIPNTAVIARVRHQLAISTGSACSSGVEAPSHVLQAMNLSEDMVEGALRISIGKFTTDDEIDRAAETLNSTVKNIKVAMQES